MRVEKFKKSKSFDLHVYICTIVKDRHDLATELLEAVLVSPSVDYDDESLKNSGPARKRMRRTLFTK